MKRIIRASERHANDFGWLKNFWLFSFSDYYAPDNVQFGSLRVFNDDVVQGSGGFPTHPHKEMEIVSIVWEGQLSHADSMGNEGDIGPCEVQRMSAGTGITHSEFNNGDSPTHFYQIWLLPDEAGLTPTYEQKCFDAAQRRNVLQTVASGQGHEGAIHIHVDAAIHLADLDAGRAIDLPMEGNARTFIYVKSGAVSVDGDLLEAGDQLRIGSEGEIHVRAERDASITVITLGR